VYTYWSTTTNLFRAFSPHVHSLTCFSYLPQPRSNWPTENPPPSRNMLSWIGTVGSNVLMLYIELFKLFAEAEDDAVPLLPDLLTTLQVG
jgi:hypothetical protein